MNYVKYDASSGPRSDKEDCTVRTLCTVSQMTYEDAWKFLYDMQGKEKTCGFRLSDWLRKNPKAFGATEYLQFPARQGHRRMTGKEFCRQYSHGRYILRQAYHVVAVVDGKLFDTWDSSGRCVYGAWKL